MKTWIVVVSLAFLVRPVLAQQGPCPNTMASSVGAASVNAGTSATCQVQFVLFGAPIGIAAVVCPSLLLTYPAHEACLGAGSPGHYCGTGDAAAVRLQKCACEEVGEPAFGFGLVVCKCRDAGTAGTISTGKTFQCQDD